MGTFLPLTATVGAAGLGILGFIDQSPLLGGLGTIGVAGLQVWTLMQLQPIRDQISDLKRDVAVLRERMNNCHQPGCPMKHPSNPVE